MTEPFVIGTPQFEWQEVNLKGKKKYYISGYISTIDPDDYNEVVTMRAQEKLLKACQERIKTERFITMDLEHEEYIEADQVLRKPKNTRVPVAKIVEAELRERGVWVKAEINRNGDRFKTVWESIKEGYLHSFSIAFAPLKKVTQKINGVVQTFIEDLNLTNVTLTGSPVNTNATFTVSLKAKLNDGDNNMTEEQKQETPKVEEQPTEEAPKTGEPAKEEATEDPKVEEVKEEDKPLTTNDLVENARALEKEKADFAAERAAFEKQKTDFEAQNQPAEVKDTDVLGQIKAKDKEIAELKAKLNAPILKSRIKTQEEVQAEVKAKQAPVGSPLDNIK